MCYNTGGFTVAFNWSRTMTSTTFAKTTSFFATALALAAMTADAAQFWRGTTDNPVWDTTSANWASSGSATTYTTYLNNTSSSQPYFDGGGASDITIAPGGVLAYVVNLTGGSYTLSGGPLTAKVIDPNGGNLTIYNTVSNHYEATGSSYGFRPRAGVSTVTVGAGGHLVGQIAPWSDSTLATRLVILENGTLTAKFQPTQIKNNKFTLCFNGGTLIPPAEDDREFVNSKFVLGAKGMHLGNRPDGKFGFVPGPIGTDSGIAKDGGIIVDEHSNYVLLPKYDCNYNGGLHIKGTGGHIGIRRDRSLGAAFQIPTDNIWFENAAWTKSSILVGHGTVGISSNRIIRIARGVTARMGSYANGSYLVVRGTIACAEEQNGIVLTIPYSQSTNSLAGPIIFQPGEGRTNRIGRLEVQQNTIIGPGTTLLLSTTKLNDSNNEVNGEYSGSPLYVHDLGSLSVTGGVLRVEGSRPITLNSYFTVSGGMADFSGHEILHARSSNSLVPSGQVSRAVTTVRNGGRLHVSSIRIAERGSTTDGSKSVLNIETGGVVRVTDKIYVHSNFTGYKATVNCNGGTLEWANTNSVYCPYASNSGDSGSVYGNSMAGISWNVLEGGLVVSNNCECRFTAQLKSGAANDGGVTKWGTHTFALYNTGNDFNGPLTIMQGEFRPGTVGVLPATCTARVAAGAYFSMNTYAHSLARIEGSGTFREVNPTTTSPLLTVTEAIAPGMGADSLGTLTISGGAINIGTNETETVALEIDVDAAGNSDCFSYPADLDLSKLTLVVNDGTKLNKDHTYTIVSATNGAKVSNSFASVTGLPETWHVKYGATTVQLRYTSPFTLIVR